MSVPATGDGSDGFRRWLEVGKDDDDGVPPPDVHVVTSGGRSVMAHSAVLASASPVLEGMLDRPEAERVIKIVGVPYESVQAFVRFLYSPRCISPDGDMEEIGKYGMHLLVLSHVYQVGWLKQACQKALAARLSSDIAVDVLVLARQCDALWLYIRCMNIISKDFATIKKTEAWKFLQENDPWLELEILEFLQDTHTRQKRRRRKRAEQRVYMELSEAMECLQHICIEGCTQVRPSRHHPTAPAMRSCPNTSTCHGLQQLIRHFATCDRKKQHSCSLCKRLWQLLRLHASICENPEPCQVPLCMQFNQRMEQQHMKEGKEGGDHDKWRLLVKKVTSARVMSYLAKRKSRQAMEQYDMQLY